MGAKCSMRGRNMKISQTTLAYNPHRDDLSVEREIRLKYFLGE
jgi:hypothetical protein